jgi:uncharacterized SAM-binding protein YcdF (DUF218 family)
VGLSSESRSVVRCVRTRVGTTLLLLVLGLMLIAFSWVSYVTLQVVEVGKQDDARPVDAIVVLSAMQERGWPSAVFRARLDHALELYKEGIAPLVVVIGRKEDLEHNTEADAGVHYLQDQGAPSDALVALPLGEDTYTSLRELTRVAKREGWGSELLVSDRFHMFRSLAMADDLGLWAYGSPTTTSPLEDAPASGLYYTVREVVAYAAYSLGFDRH